MVNLGLSGGLGRFSSKQLASEFLHFLEFSSIGLQLKVVTNVVGKRWENT